MYLTASLGKHKTMSMQKLGTTKNGKSCLCLHVKMGNYLASPLTACVCMCMHVYACVVVCFNVYIGRDLTLHFYTHTWIRHHNEKSQYIYIYTSATFLSWYFLWNFCAQHSLHVLPRVVFKRLTNPLEIVWYTRDRIGGGIFKTPSSKASIRRNRELMVNI